MTCIVAVTDHETVLIGADSAAAGEHEIHIRATRKVFETGPYVIGYTRSWRMGQILRHSTRLPDPPETRDGEELEHFLVAELVPTIRQSFAEHGFAKTAQVTIASDYREEGQQVAGAFLVGVRGHIFEVQADYQVVRPDTPYAAVGRGAIAALGALHALNVHGDLPLEDRARTALQAAEAYTQSVRGPFWFVG